MAWYLWFAIAFLMLSYILAISTAQRYPYFDQLNPEQPLVDHPDVKLLSKKILGIPPSLAMTAPLTNLLQNWPRLYTPSSSTWKSICTSATRSPLAIAD
jgi:hypothetical protein